MPDPTVLSEIARLEAEVARLQQALAELRRRVEGPKRTQTRAFTAPPPPQAALPGASDPTMPAFAPPVPPDSMPAPSPSEPVVTQTVPTSGRRRAAAANVGLSQPPPPHSHATPSRRNALPDADAGRYGYVGDERKRRR